MRVPNPSQPRPTGKLDPPIQRRHSKFRHSTASIHAVNRVPRKRQIESRAGKCPDKLLARGVGKHLNDRCESVVVVAGITQIALAKAVDEISI